MIIGQRMNFVRLQLTLTLGVALLVLSIKTSSTLIYNNEVNQRIRDFISGPGQLYDQVSSTEFVELKPLPQFQFQSEFHRRMGLIEDNSQLNRNSIIKMERRGGPGQGLSVRTLKDAFQRKVFRLLRLSGTRRAHVCGGKDKGTLLYLHPSRAFVRNFIC